MRDRLQTGLGPSDHAGPGQELDPHRRGHRTEQREQEEVAREVLGRFGVVVGDHERDHDPDQPPHEPGEEGGCERAAHPEHAADQRRRREREEEGRNEQPQVVAQPLEDRRGERRRHGVRCQEGGRDDRQDVDRVRVTRSPRRPAHRRRAARGTPSCRTCPRSSSAPNRRTSTVRGAAIRPPGRPGTSAAPPCHVCGRP